MTASHFGMTNGYFGTAYWHPEHQQVVIAHRGTDIKNVGALVTDVKGVLFNNYVEQMSSASTFANKVAAVMQEIEQEKKVSFELFFTGHSLGGWLAQITTFTTEYLEEKSGTFLRKLKKQQGEKHERNTEKDSLDVQKVGQAQSNTITFQYIKDNVAAFLKRGKTKQDEQKASSTVQDSHDVTHSYHPHTVVFDSPGCKDMLSQMADKFDVRLHGSSIDLQQLDITSYLSAPNRINTCNTHLGTVYRIFTDLSDMGWKEKHTLLYNLATHKMGKIVQALDPATGGPKILEVVDWPVSAGLTGDAEYNDFFKWAEQLNNHHPEVLDTVPNKVPKGYHLLRYQTKAYDECTKPLSIFTQDERKFLERYRWLRHVPEFFKPEDLLCVINNAEAEKEAEQKLGYLELDNESVRCPDASTLHALIPYVKRLIRFFPHVKKNVKNQLSSPEIRNRVYQYETQRYVARIHKSPLDFNAGPLGLKEFLTTDQKIWQLRMVDGDAWTGITKVYRVLQNTSCTPGYSSEGQYTMLKLKRLLTVSRMINLNALLSSMETPHLLMIVCGKYQTVNDELRDVFKELFSIVKKKACLKIILTTQPEGDIVAVIQEIATEIFGEGFITTDEHLTWSDLTASSQTAILEKTLIFQGRRVALNQLISAESMTDSFLLSDLLQGKEIRIGEEPVPSASSGYNEMYYIDRTFDHNIVIRQDILSEIRDGKYADLLASTELEFKRLCQQNPTSNVHWLAKEESGELIWHQTQGDLKTLHKYIDAQRCQSYAPSDLDKLLQQAKHQRVMLIADKAGMGKTTILTYLSKRIKQKYPAYWFVRIDLNDYTELLKAQKGKKMDEGWVLEFVSKEVLKLESDLEKELFKKSFEGNEISKVLVMVDGFDEISPKYKETVLDMLQVLKQTSLEQLWVTTRPHLKEDLEDNLQQLSYTLQPFSNVEQVEYLKKFWLQSLNLEDTNQHRLQSYATALISKLAQSIRDKEKEFTGIPLQTRMLAEAFEEEFISFYLSEKSEPELPHKLDLLGLYGRFIESKYDIYYREKSKTPAGNMAAEEQRERDLKCIHLEHQLLALEALFTEDQVTDLQIHHHSTLSDEELARIGIVQRNSEGKPHFIHRTFAEYFVAEFLINQLTKKTKQQHKQVQDFLLNKILLRTDCQVIRTFLDGLLEKSKPSNVALKEYGELLNERWNGGEVLSRLIGLSKTALHEAATEDNVHIIGLLLDSIKSGEHSNALMKMLLAKDSWGRTAWHMAATNDNLEALKKIWQWANRATPTLSYSLLVSQDKQSKTAWHLAAEQGHIKTLEKLWDWAKELQVCAGELNNVILLAQDTYRQTAWHLAAEKGNVEVLEKIWEWAKEAQVNPNELKNKLILAISGAGITPWHVAAEKSNAEVLGKLWGWAKEAQLNSDELQNKLLLGQYWNGRTAWHMAAERGSVELIDKLWGWAKEELPDPNLLKSKLLLSRDIHGLNIWQIAAVTGSVQILGKLWDWAKELQLKPEELKTEFLLSKDNYGATAWHTAALNGHFEVLEKLWDWAQEEKVNSDDLKIILFLTQDNSSDSSWSLAIHQGNIEVLRKLWGWAGELQLTPDELKNKLFLAVDNIGNTAICQATSTGSINVLKTLWGWSKETQLNADELSKMLVDAWHNEAGRYLEILEGLWLWAGEEQRNPHDLKRRLLLEHDVDGESIWHKAVTRVNVEVLDKLWDWVKEEQINPEEIKNILFLDGHQDGRLAWHLAAGGGSLEVLDRLWGWAEEIQLNANDIRSAMLLAKDKSGKTAWHLAVRDGRIMVLERLLNFAKDMQLNPGEIWNKLLLDQEEDERHAWFLAARCGNVKVLEEIWVLAKENGTPEEIKSKLLLAQNEYGQTALHLAAEGSVAVMEKVWAWAKEVQLNKDELNNKLLLAQDECGRTAWYRAAQTGSLATLEKLWSWAKEAQMKPDELKNKLLLAQDKNGNTAWQVAAEREHVEILEKLWVWAKEEQINLSELQDKLLPALDKFEKHVW